MIRLHLNVPLMYVGSEFNLKLHVVLILEVKSRVQCFTVARIFRVVGRVGVKIASLGKLKYISQLHVKVVDPICSLKM